MRHARAALASLLVVTAVGASAQDARRPDPFLAVEDADPMELARVIDRLGDDAVLERLEDDRGDDARLAAVRAAPFMEGPELALERLAGLAAGRHPYLAPAAVQSALTIARALDAQSLARRELSPTTLADAAATFQRLADDETARADLRVAASIVGAQLTAAGVPSPAADE